jgi:hypothetical protein
MPVLTYGFNAGALLTQGGWVSFSCLLAGHFLMLVHNIGGANGTRVTIGPHATTYVRSELAKHRWRGFNEE